jgi:predicted DNA-binding ribbon-helix-helix protein
VIERAARSDGARPTDLSKHSLVIAGHRTSISLERAFWEALQAIARQRHVSIASLIASVDAERGDANLSSALRVFVLSAATGSSS